MGRFVKTFFFLILLSITFGSVAQAEMAKEGSGEYRSAKTTTFDVLSMEKERLQMNYEQIGVVVIAPENSPLYNASFRFLGTLHAIKGKYTGPGFIVWTNTNGDKIYATCEVEGVLRGASKGVITFVGGTGGCVGIEGIMKINGLPGIKPSKKGIGFGISVGEFNWKIP